MNRKYYEETPKRLYSPLLEGKYKQQKYQTQNQRSNSNNEHADSLLPPVKEKILLSTKKEIINTRDINSLEVLFKTALIFLLGTGGISTLLELITIVRNLYYGEFYTGSSLIKFSISFIVTLLSIIICLGFINLIKIIKFIHINIKHQNLLIEKALSGNTNRSIHRD